MANPTSRPLGTAVVAKPAQPVIATPAPVVVTQVTLTEAVKPTAPAVEAVPQAAAVKPPAFLITSPRRTERWLKMLAYGDFGVGKTTFGASARLVKVMQDVLLCDIESGDESLADLDDIDRIQINGFKVLSRVYEFLRMHCKYRDENNVTALRKMEARFKGIPEEEIITPKKYRTVIVDSLSEVQKYCMYMLLGIQVGETRLDDIPNTPEFKEWGQSSEMIRLLVRSFRDLPMNVIFICSEQLIEDERKVIHKRPNLPGKLGNEVQGFLDCVGYMVVFEKPADEEGAPPTMRRRLYVQPGRTFQAKNRFRTSVQYINDPTMEGLNALRIGGGAQEG
jgi:hypothetical protein